MAHQSNNASAAGISFTGLLGIVFIVLKVTGVITWSWWWVLAPLWIPACIGIVLFIVTLCLAAYLKVRTP